MVVKRNFQKKQKRSPIIIGEQGAPIGGTPAKNFLLVMSDYCDTNLFMMCPEKYRLPCGSSVIKNTATIMVSMAVVRSA